MVLKLLFIFSFTYYSSSLFSSEIPDSILIKLKLLNPTEQATVLKNIAFDTYRNDMDLAINLTNKGLEIAQKNNLHEKFADLLNMKGIIYGEYSMFDSSLCCYDKAIVICDRYKLPDIKKKVGMNYGINYFYHGNYAKALEKYHLSLKIFEEQKDSLGIAHALSNIGIVHLARFENRKAIYYLKNAMNLYKKNGNSTNIITTLNAMGTAYNSINIDSSLFYLTLGLKYSEESENYVSTANLHDNIGNSYLKKGDKINSMIHFRKALAISDSINYPSAKIKALDNIGKLLLITNRYSDAIENYNKALQLSKENELSQDESIILEHITDYYEKIKDYKNAYGYLLLTKKLNDSLFNLKTEKNIQELEIKYNTEKKAHQIQEQNLQIQKQSFKIEKMQWRIASLIGGIIILLMLVYILIRKQKEHRIKLLAEKRKAEMKAGIMGEEKERQRLSYELHDGLGQSLSSIKLMVEGIKDTGKTEYLDNALKNIDGAVADLRDIAHNLMPSSLIKYGFEAAIEEIIENLNKTRRINIQFYTNNNKANISQELSFLLFRFMQELLNNTVKHSKAQNISIQIVKEDDYISLLIDDDGIGFNPEKSIKNGLGIRNIQSRVQLYNGFMSIDSGEGSGTSIHIKMPA